MPAVDIHPGTTIPHVAAERGRRSAARRTEGECTFFRGGGKATGELDTIFVILSDRRRRIVLDHLRDGEEESVTVDTLAEWVAAGEAELVDPATVSTESIDIDIARGHLPKLDAAGVVVYDDDERRVSYRGDERVDRFLDFAKREGPLP